MKINTNTHRLYKLRSDGQLVAVDHENMWVIDHCKKLWGDLHNVPEDRTVRGIFVRKSESGFVESIDEAVQQSDITVRELVPVN